MKKLVFKSRARAKKETGLSYLGAINSSSKIVKNSKILNIDTFVLYLAPYNLSGYNVCKKATPECIKGCLFSSGRAKIEEYSGKDIIKQARIKKTKLFFEQKEFFMNWLHAEITAAKIKSEKQGNKFSVRLNGTSDIAWENYEMNNNKNVFKCFSDVQFYDYTKNASRLEKCKNIANYHLTFSYAGRNLNESIYALESGYNVAVVFDSNNFPETFLNHTVINGDLFDYRPIDEKNSIVALKYKDCANKQTNEAIKNSVFVVKT